MNSPDPDLAAAELKAMQDSIYREKNRVNADAKGIADLFFNQAIRHQPNN